MRSKNVWIMAVAIGVVGCGDISLFDQERGGSLCNPRTEWLLVEPLVVARGEAVEIHIDWQTDVEIALPVTATLVSRTGSDIEVEVVLDPSEFARYEAFQMNPFGAGAGAGEVAVIAVAGQSAECLSSPSATTTFRLE